MANFERQDRLAGLTNAQIAERQALRAEFQKGLLFEGLTPGVLIKGIPGSAELEDVQLADDEHYYGRSVNFFEELGAIDPERMWRRVWQPVLALHGEYDWISDKADHERIARLSGGKFLSIAAMDHGFLHHDSLDESFTARDAGKFDPAIIDATINWINTNPALGNPKNN
jgi:pimeloyl-ACP methyl ester carboxylesterase